MRNAIVMVLVSSFVIVVVFAFLILGLTMFAEGDAFSSAVSSLLGATAGLVNIVNNSRDEDSKLNRLATKLVDAWESSNQNESGVSLNDDLRDAVVRRSKYIFQREQAERAEALEASWLSNLNPVDMVKNKTRAAMKGANAALKGELHAARKEANGLLGSAHATTATAARTARTLVEETVDQVGGLQSTLNEAAGRKVDQAASSKL